MSNTPSDIWAYLDGQLSEKERRAFEQKIEEDEALRHQVAAARILDRNLQEREPEQPSMRFVANVMERLPDLYQPISVKPLLSRKALRWAGGILATVLLINISLLWILPTGSTGELPLIGNVQQMLNALPHGWLLPLSALSVGYVAYAVLDAFLERRLLKQPKKA